MRKLSHGIKIADQLKDEFTEKSIKDYISFILVGVIIIAILVFIGITFVPKDFSSSRPTMEEYRREVYIINGIYILVLVTILSLIRKKYLNGFAFGRKIDREESNEMIKELKFIKRNLSSIDANMSYYDTMIKKLEMDMLRIRELKKLKRIIKNSQKNMM